MKDILGKFNLYLLTYKRFSCHSIIAYVTDTNQFVDYLRWMNKNIFTMDGYVIKSYLSHMYNKGLAASSRRRKIESLRLFFRYLTDNENFPEWDKILISPQVEKRLPHYLTKKEIKLLLKAAHKDKGINGQRNKMLIYLLYGTGLRISELLMLKQMDVVFNPSCVRVMGKGKKERLVPVPSSITAMLKNYLTTLKSDYLFTALYGKKRIALSRQNAALIIRTLGIQAKIDKRLYPHLLRHSYATHLLENGANIRQIQTLLGHEWLSSTEIYTHVTMKHLRKIYDKKHLRA